LTSFDPFLQEFDAVTRRAFGWPAWSTRPALPMDGTRHDNEVVFHFDLPGFDLENIDVAVDQGTLIVSAVRDEEKEKTESSRPFIRERVHGTLTRRIHLGDAYDAGKVEAAYDKGVLTVRVPVAEQVKARKVEISTGADKAITA
jgi:HSP20 family protein